MQAPAPRLDFVLTSKVSHSVDRVFHITRTTLFDEDQETQADSISAPPAVFAQARPQPKGLKARYQPFGVKVKIEDASDEDVDDVEMTQAPPLKDATSDTPKKAAKKRKHGDVEKGTPSKEETTATPAKKSKKPRVDSSKKQTPIAPPSIPPVDNAKPAKAAATPDVSSTKKSKSKKKDAEAKSSVKTPAKVTPIPPPIPGSKST